MKKITTLGSAALLVCLLAGCGGLLALAFSAVAVGSLYTQVTDFLGIDSDEYSLYIDGYDLGIHPEASGRLNLNGLPAGGHVLSLVTSDKRTGFHVNATIVEGERVNLGAVTPIQGAVISGKLRRQVGSATVALAGARVAAIFGGGSLIAAGASPLSLPTGSSHQVILGFTDSEGNYKLGPAQYGQWLVTAAYPGYLVDAAVVTVASGSDATGTNLTLNLDSSAAAAATVRGSVLSAAGATLSQPLVVSELGTPLAPATDSARAAALQSQLGTTLAAQPWFQWQSLATVGSTLGAYDFEVPAGGQSVYAFKYGYTARTTELDLSAGSSQTADFSLPAR